MNTTIMEPGKLDLHDNCLPAFVITNSIYYPGFEEKLDISKTEDLAAIQESERDFGGYVLLVFPKSDGLPGYENIAIKAKMGLKVSMSTSTYKLRLKTLDRVKLGGIVFNKTFKIFKYEDFFPPFEEAEEQDITFARLVKTLEDSEDVYKTLRDLGKPYDDAKSNYVYYVDYVANNMAITLSQKKEILLTERISERMILLMKYVSRRGLIKDIERKIDNEVHQAMDKAQKEYYLREKIKAIQNELGDKVKRDEEVEEMRTKLQNKKMPEEIREKALKELKKYTTMSSYSPDATTSKGYLDLIIDLPWNEYSEDEMDIKKVKKILDEDHFGLEKVKDRILEFISVNIKTKKNSKTILCLYGPPGVGKTSLGRSIARALNKKFVKTSLGGISDEAEIRGHRRTYVAALPGRILKGIKDAGTSNPLFLIDEIDKMSQANHGDPASAMLEVLDPEKNYAFIDNFLEEPYDLSRVFFVATANYIENMPPSLRDRIELIEVSSYTEYEKLQIAIRHLIPKVLADNNMTKEEFIISEEVILHIIRNYTVEAGVRELQRILESLVRKSIKEMLMEDLPKIEITSEKLVSYLGQERHSFNKQDYVNQVGVVNGLAYTAFGGDTMPIEVALYPGKGEVILTGKLGDVMKESAQTALSYIKSNAEKFKLDLNVFQSNSFHIHVPEGAVPKDGPSAGVTIATAIFSAVTKYKVDSNYGMTGEITLRGKILPIGGLREKSIAALRSGIKTIFIPKDNERDIEELPQEVKDKLKIIPVSFVDEILNSEIINK